MTNRSPSTLALLTDAYGGQGGIAQYNRDLVSALANSPTAGQIYILPRHAPDPVPLLPRGVVQAPAISSRARYAAVALATTLRSRPRWIFCGHIYMTPLGATLARAVSARMILQLHGVDAWEAPGWARERGVAEADLVLCVSHDTRERFLEWSGHDPEKVVVVHNTVGDDFFPSDAAAFRTQLGADEKVVLLSVSRLDARDRYKGQDRVISMIPRLRELGFDVVYHIVGDGDDRPRLELLAQKLGVTEHVRFFGQVLRERLADHYRVADLFILPSTGEGFGIVFLEAMACGTPAIGLAVGGAVDALVDGELGVAVGEQDLFEATVRLLRAPRVCPTTLSRHVRDRFGASAFKANVLKAFAALD